MVDSSWQLMKRMTQIGTKTCDTKFRGAIEHDEISVIKTKANGVSIGNKR